MRRRATLTLTGLLSVIGAILPFESEAQLLAVAPDPGGGKSLFEVSTGSGALAGSGPDVASCCSVLRGQSAIDEAGLRFFFVGDHLVDGMKRLYGLAIPSGTVLSSPTLVATNEYNFPEWAPVAGELLVAYRDKSTSDWYLAELSPATGALVDISSVALGDCCASWTSGVSSLNEAGERLYFVGRQVSDLAWSLFSIDTANGLVVASPALSVSGQYQALEYDASSGALYLFYRDGDSKGQLATVNPATGVVTNRGSGIANCCNTPLGSLSALDPDQERFHIVVRRDSESDDRIFSLRLSDGSVITDPTLPPTQDPDFVEFLPFLFADGFESGDVSRWTSSAP